ncbi:hypothetical protein [Enterococcus canintestini]
MKRNENKKWGFDGKMIIIDVLYEIVILAWGIGMLGYAEVDPYEAAVLKS